MVAVNDAVGTVGFQAAFDFYSPSTRTITLKTPNTDPVIIPALIVGNDPLRQLETAALHDKAARQGRTVPAYRFATPASRDVAGSTSA
jgi:hypothetical protein